MPFVILETSPNFAKPAFVGKLEQLFKNAWTETGKKMEVDGCSASDVGGVIVAKTSSKERRCLFVYNNRGEKFHQALKANIQKRLMWFSQHVSFFVSELRLEAVETEQWFTDPTWTIRTFPRLPIERRCPFPGPPGPEKEY